MTTTLPAQDAEIQLAVLAAHCHREAGGTMPRRHPVPDLVGAAERLRADPGVWVLVASFRASTSADGLAGMIRTGRHRAYGPRGAFEARPIPVGPAVGLFARYVGSAS